MQLKTLKEFIELAQAGSFYRAAKNLHLSQQGLNKAISSMEAELGSALVERSPQGIRLTHEGEVVLKYAQAVQAGYEAMVDDLYGVHTQVSDRTSRVMVHVSYYSSQIASTNLDYVGMLTKNVIYIEEPFDKLIRHAETSDGSDLVFLDVHPHSMARIITNPHVVFDPVLITKRGFIWKDGSPLSNEEQLHREIVSKVPVAINTHREIAQLSEEIFRDSPFEEVRMGASTSQMMLAYAKQSDDVACELDSFSYYLARCYGDIDMSDLHFTPLATPQALCQVGFLYPKGVRMSLDAAQIVKTLRNYLAKNCADYFNQYPLVR